MSQQRWFIWRNRSDTVCPSGGAVFVTMSLDGNAVDAPPLTGDIPNGGSIDPAGNLTENELFGTDIVLHGIRPFYDYEADQQFQNPTYRGLDVRIAFNGDLPVFPGQTGMLTWDLPTWAAMEDGYFPSDPSAFVSGTVNDLATAFDDWTLINQGVRNLYPNTAVLNILAANAATKRVLVGDGVVFAIVPQEIP